MRLGLHVILMSNLVALSLIKIMICLTCKNDKAETAFYRHPSIQPDGIRKRCNECRNKYRRGAHAKDPEITRQQSRAWIEKNKARVYEMSRLSRRNNKDRYKGYALKKSFGISLDTYRMLYENQNGLCYLCEKPERIKDQNGATRRLAMDHDHQTGTLRRLLCWQCNTGIGKLYDSPDLLRKAAEYIERYKKS